MTDSFNTWGIFYTHCAIWTLKSAINLDDCGSEKIFFSILLQIVVKTEKHFLMRQSLNAFALKC